MNRPAPPSPGIIINKPLPCNYNIFFPDANAASLDTIFSAGICLVEKHQTRLEQNQKTKISTITLNCKYHE
jgi:hypothetical protein